jgi:hypothetical protein
LLAGVLLAGQPGQPDPVRVQAIALQDALDGPSAGERTDALGLLSSARMGVAPIKQSRAAGAACAWSRRRMERIALSNSGGIR